MSGAAIKYMDNLMKSIGIPYEMMEWTSGLPPDCYFVGDYIEEPSPTKEESGYQASTFILRGFTRGDWSLLEQAKAKLEKYLHRTAILENGSGIAVSYESARPVPTGDAELKSIKINLAVKEWRGEP